MAQIVINVSNFDGFLPLFFEKIGNLNKDKKFKLEINGIPLDQNLTIRLLIVQLIISLKVVCIF